MKTLATLLTAIWLAALVTPALAAPNRPKIQHFNLKGSDIEGAIIQPDGRWIQASPTKILESLIEVRLDFNPEMVKLTEEL
ncbi:MAG: hypothetical protein RBU30_00860 [Polyangia bacterium]|jgi:hypothetical protein|nr:hypothetical protein [Polyangia bacterium]